MNSLVNTFSIVALFFLFTLFGFSQTTPPRDPITITITLMVDAEKFDSSEMQKWCKFKVKRSDRDKAEIYEGDLREFCVVTQNKDIIIWQGEPNTWTKKTVNIKEIRYHEGTRIFKHKNHKNGLFSKKVDAKVEYDSKDNADYKYDITFKIKRAGKANGKHKIDPKMKIMPREILALGDTCLD